MFKKIIALGALVASSQSFAANPNVDLTCDFTEPFYQTTLNLQTGRLLKHEPDWTGNSGGSIVTVLHENLQVSLLPGEATLRIEAVDPDTNELVMSGAFNFLGSNGMSDHNYPVDIAHHNVFANGDSLYGGCDFQGVAAYDPYEFEGTWLDQFSKDASKATALCFNRAISNWTIAESSYADNTTVFYVLYHGEVVPGEAGNVSSNFSSAENEHLDNLLLNTQIPPQDAFELNLTKQSMWDYCTTYSEFLQNRYVTHF